MEGAGHKLTIGGRVNADQLARVDAAARLRRLPRAHFIVEATLQRADEVIQVAARECTVVPQSPDPGGS